LKPSVVYLLDTLQTGGAEKSLLAITKQFVDYNPIFVILFKSSEELKPEFEKAGLMVINLALPPSYKFKRISRIVAAQIASIKPLLIHSTLFRSDMVSRRLAKQMRLPLINSLVNNSYSKQRYQSEPLSIKIKLWLLQQWDAFTANDVTLFLSNSETIRGTNARALRLQPDKIRVIYRGRSVKPTEEITRQQIDALRSELNLTNKKVFLNVSRLIDRKGQLDLIKAFGRVCNQRTDCILQEIRMHSLDNQVLLLGNRMDIPLLLKSSDYFVFPTYYEGLPGTLIEAMFAKIPIVASDIPENRECVDSGMALFHSINDVDSLFKQMLTALEDEQWPERTQNAFDYAMRQFEISKIAEQYEALYDELIGK